MGSAGQDRHARTGAETTDPAQFEALVARAGSGVAVLAG